jgi:hypothetical protein
LLKKFITELDRSLVIDDKTRDYWLKNYLTFPLSSVEFFYEQLFKINQHIDEMIATGLDADPELAEEIINKGKMAKRKAYKYMEKESIEEENPEEFLKVHLV